jgi:hypothetical protein
MCSICDTNLKAQPYSTSFYKLTFVVIGALAGGVVAFFYDKTPSPGTPLKKPFVNDHNSTHSIAASPTSIGIFALIAGFFGVLFWWPCKFMGGMMLLFHYNYYVSGIVMIGYLQILFTVANLLQIGYWMFSECSYILSRTRVALIRNSVLYRCCSRRKESNHCPTDRWC